MAKWHINYYLFRRGTPISAGVLITDACNSRCIMCNLWKTKKPSIYPRAAQERAIDSLARIGCYFYSIGGGEASMVKDLPDRLAYAARRIPFVRTVTNGLLMSPELARALNTSGIKEISLSIDGTKEFHNLMRGRPDAFEKAWSALDMLCTYAPKLQVIVNSIITPYNLQSLRELGKSLDRFPKVYQQYLPLTSHEIFRTHNQHTLPISGEAVSTSEIVNFLDEAILNPKIINSTVFLRKAKIFFKSGNDIIPEQKRCLYPYHCIEFDPKGFAYPCRTGMDFEKGVPPDSDLKRYFKSKNYRLLQKKLERCIKCHGSMMVCYYEPRLNFPLHNLLYYKFIK
jgi:MoaA/NifB/PqqE/SkfB family radical SAM enzyme